MQPIVNGLKAEYAGQLVFQQLNANTEAGRAAMDAYALRGHPSYAIVGLEGDVRWTAVGPLSVEQLKSSLIQHGGD